MDRAIVEFNKRRAERLKARYGENYQAIMEFRERRKARLDANDKEGHWVTTENDHKVHINENGEPDMGNPHVIEAMKRGGLRKSDEEYLSAARDSDDAIEFWLNLSEEQQKRVGKEYKEVYERVKKHAGEKSEWVEPRGKVSDMPVKKLEKPTEPMKFKFKEKKSGNETAVADADLPGEINIFTSQGDLMSDHVFYHEMGHQLSHLGLGADILWNPGNLWGRYNRKKKFFESPYGNLIPGLSPEESFAELFSDYIQVPDHVKEKAPDVYNYFSKLTEKNPWVREWLKESLDGYEKAVKEYERIYRSDSEDEEGRWITTENGHHVHLNENGEPDIGNKHVIEKMTDVGTERVEEKPLIKPIKIKTAEDYKNYAETINLGDRKAVVAAAKKDPEFKELVDAISLYTQGAYGEQKRLSREMVKNGIDAVAKDDYPARDMYSVFDAGSVRQIWNGQKLSESNSSMVGGVISMVEAINNAENYPKELYRIADDRTFGGMRPDWKERKLYLPPKIGDKIKMDAPTSFTKDRAVLRDIAPYKIGDKIIYTLEPGARALDIEHLSRYKQKEALTCGEFEVVDVKCDVYPMFKKKDADERNLKRFEGRPTYTDENGDEWYGRLTTYITIRQIGKTEFGKREDSNAVYYDCRSHFDDEDVEWITINGTHVPIKDGDLQGEIGDKIEAESENNLSNQAGKDDKDISRKNKELKDNWLRGNTREKAKRYWEFLEDLPIGSLITDGVDEYKKIGNDEYQSVEYGDSYSTRDLLDEANFMFDDYIQQIKELGDTPSEKRQFPEEIAKEYEETEAKEAIRNSAQAFEKASGGGKEIGPLTLYNAEDFKNVMDIMETLPIGSEVGNNYQTLVKYGEGMWEDKVTGERVMQFRAALYALDKAKFEKIKVSPPTGKELEPWTERQKYYAAINSAEEIDSYRKIILERSFGKPDYDEIARQLSGYCDEGLAENLRSKAAAERDAYAEERSRRTLERIKSPYDINSAEDATDYLRAKGYFQGDPWEVDENVDLSGTHAACAFEVAKSIDRLCEDYPFLKGKLGGIKTVKDEDMPYEDRKSYAYASSGKKVVLNRDYYDDPLYLDESYDASEQSGWCVSGTEYNSIIDHEYGHVIEQFLNEKLGGRRASDIVMERVAMRRFNLESPEEAWDYPEYFDLIRSSVSRYSVENYGTKRDENGELVYKGYGENTEVFAEGFSGSRCSSSPNETVKMIGEEIDKLIKEVFG